MEVHVHKSVQEEVDTSSAHGDKRLIHTWHTHVFPITRLCKPGKPVPSRAAGPRNPLPTSR